MSKHYLLAIGVVVIFIVTAFSFAKSHKMNKPVPVDQDGFAVVELFTSEGCSSCPSADEAVARLLSKNRNNVFILCYHVDYWNRLGWKDPFSKAAYSERQQQYAAVFKLDGVYTPQIVINGTSEFVGSDEEKLSSTVTNDLAKAPLFKINIDVKKTGGLLTINYAVEGKGEETQFLNIALVQREATISVKNGENGGRTLRHVNIVRELRTVDADTRGIITLEIPGELSGIPLQLTAYTQNKKTLQISGVTQKAL